MTRIIGGFAGSLTLEVPRSGTRPTSDMVREAIFSALVSRELVAGARVLDLYAGSGALGLEAASRGAASVTLVDSSNAAVTACRKNAAHILRAAPSGKGGVAAVGMGSGSSSSSRKVTIDVSSSPVHAFLTGARQFWDVVFLDPPYELGAAEVSTALAALVPRLDPDAVVVLERSSRDPAPVLPDGLELDRRKDYGDTTLFWLYPAAE